MLGDTVLDHRWGRGQFDIGAQPLQLLLKSRNEGIHDEGIERMIVADLSISELDRLTGVIDGDKDFSERAPTAVYAEGV